ncbi:hypothetical protein [Pseudomonas sp. NA-150]|uniref:hypothetical protein n=1 Tax=Pseudomonas sp. NA-150 TaxID=3367525 RepID=UPI0037CB58FC
MSLIANLRDYAAPLANCSRTCALGLVDRFHRRFVQRDADESWNLHFKRMKRQRLA